MNTLDEIISLTSELIRFKSMHSNPEAIRACADFIVQWCADNDIRATQIERKGVPSILIMPDEDNRARLGLMAHIDVVDAADDMFEPRIENDRLYGRGAGDDKYAAALSLILFRDRLMALHAKGMDQNDMVFGVIITGDEEIGGANGAGYAMTKVQCDYVIALDGGSPERMVLKEKGIINMAVTAHGKAAHGARPWLGQNAIDALIEDYQAIKALFTEDTEDHWHRTVNFGIVRAGESVNQVPETATGHFNIRYTENDDPQAIISAIEAAVSGDVSVERIDPVFASPESEYTERLLRISGAEPVQEHGASDARYLQDNGMAGVVWGAEVFGSIHTSEECVSIPSVGNLHDAIRTLLLEMENEI
jgi:succinyl-diaminopimelate desuccinylase